mgnify:CR=1 FL=1
MSTMSAYDAHRLELQVAMQEAYYAGDIDAAEELQRMIDEFDECAEEQ